MARWSRDRNIAATVVARPDSDAHQRSEDPWERLRRELDRARRYGRPLALIQITGESAAIAAPTRRRRFRRADSGDAVTLDFLHTFLRAGDEVWRDRDRIFVMLPEADCAHAYGMVERLRTRAAHVIAGTDVRMASFPEDGLTAVALLDELSQVGAGLKRLPQPAARRLITEDGRLKAG